MSILFCCWQSFTTCIVQTWIFLKFEILFFVVITDDKLVSVFEISIKYFLYKPIRTDLIHCEVLPKLPDFQNLVTAVTRYQFILSLLLIFAQFLVSFQTVRNIKSF